MLQVKCNKNSIFFALLKWKSGQVSIHFELQVSNQWTNFAEIWPTYCHIVVLKNCACKVWFVCSFLSIFSQTYVILIFICSQQKNNCNRQNLKIMHFCSQRCQEMNSILTSFCCLFKAGLDSNLQILLVLQKAVHFWNMWTCMYWIF